MSSRTTCVDSPACEVDLGEGFELFVRTGQARRIRCDVALDDLAPRPIAAVVHIDRDPQRCPGAEAVGRKARLAEFEGGVAQPVSEGVARFDAPVFEAPVAHEQPLAVAQLSILTGEVVMGRAVLETYGHGGGQATPGIGNDR